MIVMLCPNNNSAGCTVVTEKFMSEDLCMYAARNIEAEFLGPRRQSVIVRSLNCIQISP
jgi:hypothetical protein